MPQAMVSGLFCVMFGIIAAVGLSQMQVRCHQNCKGAQSSVTIGRPAELQADKNS